MPKNSKLTGIILIVIGAILLIWPGNTLETFCRLLGWLAIIGGILEAVIGFREPRNNAAIITGAVIALIGILLASNTGLVVSYLPFVVGLITAISGAMVLVRAFTSGSKNSVRAMYIIGGVIAVFAGLIVMMNAYETAKLLMVILGIFLIYFGLIRVLEK